MDIFIHNSVTATIIQVEHYFTRAARINVRPFRQNISYAHSNSHPVTDRTKITRRRIDYKIIIVTHPTLFYIIHAH